MFRSSFAKSQDTFLWVTIRNFPQSKQVSLSLETYQNGSIYCITAVLLYVYRNVSDSSWASGMLPITIPEVFITVISKARVVMLLGVVLTCVNTVTFTVIIWTNGLRNSSL
jgi:hypothetical protein